MTLTPNKTPNNELYNFFREKFAVPVRMWCYRFLRRLLAIFIIALIANFFFSYFFYTPKMWALRAKNNILVAQYEQLGEKINASAAQLLEIKKRDHGLYRSIFSADTINMPFVWTPYPQERYANVGFGRYATLMNSSLEELDNLARQIFLESISMDEIEHLAVTKDVMMEHLPTIWPIDRKLMRGNLGAFGIRVHPIRRVIRPHDGIDIPGTIGVPVYATGDGVVVDQHPQSGYGLQVMINHNFGYKTRYAHLNKILVTPGQWVKRGEKIAEMGNTGASTGPHLHYEVIHRGTPVNPINYLSRDMSSEEFREIVQNARNTTFEKDE